MLTLCVSICFLLSEGTQNPQLPGKKSNVAGIVIGVILVIFVVIAAVCAFIYREQLMQKWQAFKQKAPGTKRYDA